MITDKELEKIDGFYLDPKTKYYCDGEDYAIVPTSKNRQEWDFCSYDCVNGDIEPIFRIERNTTLDDFSDMFYLVTKDELIFND